MSEAVDDPTEHEPTERSVDTAPVAAGAAQAAPDEPDEASPTAVDPGRRDAAALGQIDVIGIESDLDGVQAALARLADGTYWTDEVTGEPILADVLAADPLARRA